MCLLDQTSDSPICLLNQSSFEQMCLTLQNDIDIASGFYYFPLINFGSFWEYYYQSSDEKLAYLWSITLLFVQLYLIKLLIVFCHPTYIITNALQLARLTLNKATLLKPVFPWTVATICIMDSGLDIESYSQYFVIYTLTFKRNALSKHVCHVCHVCQFSIFH